MAEKKSFQFSWLRRIIVLIMVFTAIFIITKPFHPASRFNSLTGFDVFGWFRHSGHQVQMYDARVAYKEKENLSCADQWGGVENFITLMKVGEVKNGNITYSFSNVTDNEKGDAVNCMEKILKGPSSPRDDIPAMIKKVKSVFAGEPEPQLVEKVVYRPGESGVNGMTVYIPGGFTRVSCEGKIRQSWYNPGEYHRWINDCSGIRYNNMPSQDVRLMPLQKPQHYGAVLIDDVFTAQSQKSSITINLNIPRRNEEYATIVGEYTLSFYR